MPTDNSYIKVVKNYATTYLKITVSVCVMATNTSLCMIKNSALTHQNLLLYIITFTIHLKKFNTD